MADDKKPKIDLKARLGKTTAAPTPAPAPVAPQVTPSGRPMPMPQEVPQVTPSGRPMPMQAPVGLKVPTPMASAGGLPIPGGFAPPGQPGGYDPTNPLAAAVAAAPYQAQRAPAPPPEPQRIEIDDLTLKQVSGSALKKGIVIGAVFAVFLGGVGYVAGGASEQAAGRTKSKEGAADLAVNAAKARDQLKKLAEKMTDGRTQLVVNHKFPDTLSADLGGINVDFDGKQLEGRRFSGYSTDTTRELVEFITAVQGVNERKMLIQGLLNRLKKPITDQFSVPPGQTKINYVVAVDKDPHGNVAGFLSRLVDPITSTGGDVTLPPELTFANPGGGGNAKAAPFKNGDIFTKHEAIYIVPKTFDTVCPSATGGQVAQLGAQISSFIAEVGETPEQKAKREAEEKEAAAKARAAGKEEEPVMETDTKPGLIERAEKLIKDLGTVGT